MVVKPRPIKHRGTQRQLIFISHHGMDTWVAKRIEEKINLCGAETFLDQTKISIGEDFEAKVMKSLALADEVVALLTPWALTRPYVWTELGFALANRKRIVGILYGVKPEDPALPEYMRRRLMIDINNLDRYLNQLKKRMGLSKGK